MKKHIIDEFAEVRAERRKWTLDEEAICRRLLRTGADLVGDEYVATLQSFERQELERELCSNSDSGAQRSPDASSRCVSLSDHLTGQAAPAEEGEDADGNRRSSQLMNRPRSNIVKR